MANDSKVPSRVVAAIVAVLVAAVIVLAWYGVSNQSPSSSPPPSSPASADPSMSPTLSTEPEFPTAATTGVRPGVILTDSDSLVVDKPGTVIEGLRVKGRIVVKADNVVIRDTLVQGGGTHYPIRIARGARNVLIEYVEVQNKPGGGIGIFFNGGSGTVRYADIHSATDGVRIQADNVVIEYSYIHDLMRSRDGHHDSIQIRSGDHVMIRGNALHPYVTSTGDPMNAAIQIGSLIKGPLIDLRVEGNFMDGGNYTINGGKGIATGSFLRNIFGPHARYGIRTNLSPEVEWSENVMAGTGEPV